MKMLAAIGFALALSFVQPAWAQKAETAREPDAIVEFSDEDAQMNAAIAEARRTYPQFLAHFDAAPAQDSSNYLLKVGLPSAGGGHEHVWIDGLRRENGRLVGALANEPGDLPGMHVGSRIEIDDALVSDWAIITRAGMYGGFTQRVMLPHLSPSEAAELRRMLAPTLLPPDWAT